VTFFGDFAMRISKWLRIGLPFLGFILLVNCERRHLILQPTKDDGSWFILSERNLPTRPQHLHHARRYGRRVCGFNYFVLKGIDKVQATAPDGGGYFTGKDAKPTESPIGYELQLFGKPLLAPPRSTSYCSGATYGAFIEAMNLLYPGGEDSLKFDQYEALRMQEIDGGRREDGIKFWGHWNADGFGNHFALWQYSGIGREIKPANARPGDFLNISWKKGGGHSVIFLGWYKSKKGEKSLVYWSSQKATNGYGDQVIPLERIANIKIIRLTNPEKVFSFNPGTLVTTRVPGDVINFK